MNNLVFVPASFPASLGVQGMTTTRADGVSEGRYAGLNLATHVGDRPESVIENRHRLAAVSGLKTQPLWLEQHHGSNVFELEPGVAKSTPRADAAVCRVPGRALAVLTADCLPVLFASTEEPVIGVAHAGWRGLAGGVLENTVTAMKTNAARIHAWLGPAIGPRHFEVGSEVREVFVAGDRGADTCFRSLGGGKWLADLAGLAHRRLQAAGIEAIEHSGLCTFSDPRRFYSYRRDGECGRMASLLWMGPA
ncbi:MAG: peptidoglycan editing factor PgeF [Gammaproteobacteria bacterium]|nr:peptidoglycan editing factor PgeF [Gammaproteobacteria bacterium]